MAISPNWSCSCYFGEIVDFDVMSKHCDKCKTYKAKHTEQEFEEWWEKHKDLNECKINYQSTFRQMEKTDSLILFQCSEERLKLRYTSLLGDGDTKTIKDINKEMPYGPGLIVSKEECVRTCGKTLSQAPYDCASEVRARREWKISQHEGWQG